MMVWLTDLVGRAADGGKEHNRKHPMWSTINPRSWMEAKAYFVARAGEGVGAAPRLFLPPRRTAPRSPCKEE